jgi:hypothetical protein
MSVRSACWAALLITGAAGCGGSTGSVGSSAQTISVGIAPSSTSAGLSAQVQFASSVTGTSNVAVAWASDCGSVTQTGLYTAPGAEGTCHVTATSQADSSKSAQATVQVTTTPEGAWRPFSADSPWNTPIPPSPALEANSAQLVQNFIASTSYGPHLDVNIAGYSIPLYWADANTSTYPMKAKIGGEGWSGYPATMAMPIPAGAQPDPQSDHHMLVISADRKLEYGCYNVSYSASASPNWQADLCATADLTGTGVRVMAAQANPWYLAQGSRACGFPLVAGLIRVEEIQAGRIDHALVIAYPGIQAGHYMSPASTPSAIGNAPGGVGVPCGGRFQYDPSVDVTTLGLSRAGQIIVRALQEYGAYVGDFSGALSLYAENSPAAQSYWAGGVLGTYELEGKIDLAKFRIIQYGTTY